MFVFFFLFQDFEIPDSLFGKSNAFSSCVFFFFNSIFNVLWWPHFISIHFLICVAEDPCNLF